MIRAADMFWFFYNVHFHAAYVVMLPRFFLRMRRRGGYRRDFGERLFRISEDKRRCLSEHRKLWVHAVSVGELGVGLAFMREWRHRHPEATFLLTVNTSTAHRLAAEKLGEGDVLLYPPVDSPPVVRRVFRTVNVQALVLVETEMWPNLLRAARRAGVPTMLLNGRVSDRSFRRLRRVRWMTRRLYALVDLYAMQSERDARRARALGAPEDRTRVMHSAKYDVADRDPDEEAGRRDRLIACGFLPPDGRMVLGSSTWPGEERVLMEIMAASRRRHPKARLVLVPRHFERRGEVLADAAALTLRAACWSDASDEDLGAADVVVVDTTGELAHFTGFADLVFVGKSLFRREGQNPLEAANAGACILVGPGMDNFRAVMEDLRAADAVREIRDASDLARDLEEDLRNPRAARARGLRARDMVESRKGSLARSARALEELTGIAPAGEDAGS